jgi:hypothetical protein
VQQSITQVQPPLEFIPPAYHPGVKSIVRSLLPLWQRWRVGVQEIQVAHPERLAQLYQQFEAQKVRFLLAFRHPTTNDPYCLAHLLWRVVPQVAREQQIPLRSMPHAHFIYDRGIPLWAGRSIGWLYSRLGGTPIRRSGLDLAGLRSARHLFANGKFPMAAAPEGATNGHSEVISPIEPGIAQFGFWCVEDLMKADRTEQVLLVPIGIQYHLIDQPWIALEHLLTQLEIDSGLGSDRSISSPQLDSSPALAFGQEASLYHRLFQLGEHLLSIMEQYYHKFYPQALSSSGSELNQIISEDSPLPASHRQLAARLQALLNAALKVAEDYFNLVPKGTVNERCRRIEQAGWERIYREDLKQVEKFSLLERGLANRLAEEANLRLWHMRLVESFVSVTGHYVLEKTTVDRFAETLLLLWEMVARIKGEAAFPRPKVGLQSAQVVVGEAISVSDRWHAYKSNRRQAIASLTQELQTALEHMII